MPLSRHHNRALALLTLATSLAGPLAAQVSSAPAVLQQVSTNTTISPILSTPTAEDYRQMQASAPEVLVVRITSVKTEVGKPADNSVESAPLMVTAQAAVIRVIHSATNLKNGDVIYLLYGHATPVPGKSSYIPIPVITNNTEYTAYLAGGPKDKDSYRPAAGAQSFIDNSKPVASGAAETKPTGPIADPTLLPTPDNPTPVGVPRLTHENLARFAQTSVTDGHWGVSIAEADPLPLQTAGKDSPTLLAYYPAAIRAPATQPKVLVYVTGGPTTNLSPVVSTERALIIDGNGRLLGDVVWALRVAEGQTPPPLPVWRWSTYKLEVEDSGTHAVQTILLDGSSAPAAGKN